MKRTKGLRRHKDRWHVIIQYDGKPRYCGSYLSEDAAIAAYHIAYKELYTPEYIEAQNKRKALKYAQRIKNNIRSPK